MARRPRSGWLIPTGPKGPVVAWAAWFAACLTSAVLWSSPAGATPPAPRMLLPVIELQLDQQRLRAEVAATPDSRTLGLMHRESLPPDHGMLFVFSAPTHTCFWMKNTPLPLSIAFIDAHGTILNIRDMQPHTTDSHCPAGAFLYALETPRGWFRARGIGPGSRVTSPLPPAAAQ